MNYLVLDAETSTLEKGSPFHPDNRVAIIGTRISGVTTITSIEFDGRPYATRIKEIQGAIEAAEILVGFNWKFDGHWLRRYGIKWEHKRIWDCAVFEFLEDAQRTAMPSLAGTLNKYGLGEKEVGIEQFWDKGIDTFLVPRDVLWKRASSDVENTEALFLRQWEVYSNSSKQFQNLFKLEMKDLVALSEMEWNGQLYNAEEANRRSLAATETLKEFDNVLSEFSHNVPINWNSTHQRSAVIFGGTISWEERYIDGLIKSGANAGTPRHRIKRLERTFERLVDPPKTALLADGEHYSTDEKVLRGLQKSGRHAAVVRALLGRGELAKLKSTYYDGFARLLEEFKWVDNVLHGQFHQFVAVTGRLSSSRPNLQNLSSVMKELFVSRPGYTTVQLDFKTLEWVVALYLSRDPIGIQEWLDFMAGKRKDAHTLNQVDLSLPDRATAKIFLFRLIYGGTEYSYVKDPDFNWISDSAKWWKKRIDAFYSKYTGLSRWHGRLVEQAIQTGGYELPTGRIYRYTPVQHPKFGLQWPRTQILNYPVQGLAAEIVKIARVLVMKEIRRTTSLFAGSLYLSSVHDSLVVDVPNENVTTVMAALQSICTVETQKVFEELFGLPWDVPLKVDISYGLNQGDMKEWNG